MVAGARKPGDRIDDYRIVRWLASGGNGDVYEAVHEFTRRGVALKCLKDRAAGQSDFAERMRLEAVVLSRLRHPNIVTVFDAGITPDGIVWIAMDLLGGTTLRERLRERGRMSVVEALRVACSIASGVAAAHGASVVHRDLKPENVFVTDTGEVKVLDLGTAKFVGYDIKPTETLRTLGTPAYMAPEQLHGQPVNARTDVYALGLILYEMLAGRHAFARNGGAELPNGFELTQAQLFSIPAPIGDFIAGFPEDVYALVARATAKAMGKRFPTMEEFEREMRGVLARHGGEPARAGSIAPRAGLKAPPLGGVIARGAVLGALLGIATASFSVLIVVRERIAPLPASNVAPPGTSISAPSPRQPASAPTDPSPSEPAAPVAAAVAPSPQPAQPSLSSLPVSPLPGSRVAPSPRAPAGGPRPRPLESGHKPAGSADGARGRPMTPLND